MNINNIVLTEIKSTEDLPPKMIIKDVVNSSDEPQCVLSHLQAEGRVFMLEWDGTSDPEGVEIAGYIVDSTSSGFIDGHNNDTAIQTIGQYDRLKTNQPHHQQMLIFLCTDI